MKTSAVGTGPSPTCQSNITRVKQTIFINIIHQKIIIINCQNKACEIQASKLCYQRRQNTRVLNLKLFKRQNKNINERNV